MAEKNNSWEGLVHLFADTPIEIPPDIDSRLDNLDQKVWNQIAELSKKNPDFSILTDELLRRTSKLPKEEREGYVNEAHDFYSIVTCYRDPYFLRNFFGYLFDKTRSMVEDETKRKFVFIARSAYDSVLNALNEKTKGKKKPNYLLSLIRPERNLVEDFRFNRKDYETIKESLCFRLQNYILEKGAMESEEFSIGIYKAETVAEIIEMVSEKAEILEKK